MLSYALKYFYKEMITKEIRANLYLVTAEGIQRNAQSFVVRYAQAMFKYRIDAFVLILVTHFFVKEMYRGILANILKLLP